MSGELEQVKKPGAKKKWDIDLIRQLYMTGYEVAEIVKLDQFKGLSVAYLNKVLYANRWHEIRKELREKSKALGDIKLVDVFKEQGDKHLGFMVDQLVKHRDLIEKRSIPDSMRGQGESLSLLKEYDSLARKVLGIDEAEKIKDRGAVALRLMVNFQQNGPIKPPNIAAAVEVLPSNQNVTTGILAQRNAMPERTQDHEIRPGDDEGEEILIDSPQETPDEEPEADGTGHEKAGHEKAPTSDGEGDSGEGFVIRGKYGLA